MCLFCAAVPMTISLGAAASAKQKTRVKAAIERGESPRIVIPVGKVAAVVLAGTIAGSVVYHATFQG